MRRESEREEEAAAAAHNTTVALIYGLCKLKEMNAHDDDEH
jgi:hypothetical protein